MSRRSLSVLRVLAASEYVTVPLCAPGPTDKLHVSAMKMKRLLAAITKGCLLHADLLECVELTGELNRKINPNALLVD
jgi:hypothetical protein